VLWETFQTVITFCGQNVWRLSSDRARQLYRPASQHPPGHPVTAAVRTAATEHALKYLLASKREQIHSNAVQHNIHLKNHATTQLLNI